MKTSMQLAADIVGPRSGVKDYESLVLRVGNIIEADRDKRRLLRSVLSQANHLATNPACPECDPGSEGPEVWGELANEINRVLNPGFKE